MWTCPLCRRSRECITEGIRYLRRRVDAQFECVGCRVRVTVTYDFASGHFEPPRFDLPEKSVAQE